MTNEQREASARAFLSMLGKPDAAVLARVVASDAIWSLPGSSSISGEARGVDGVMLRPDDRDYGVRVEVQHATFSGAGRVAMILHNTALGNERNLDEHICAVFTFYGDRISRLDTYLSDVTMAEAFLADPLPLANRIQLRNDFNGDLRT